MKRLMLVFIAIMTFNTNVFADNDYVFDPKNANHYLYKPDGKGPFPAILLLHASTGIVNVNHDWAIKLKNHGYVVYVIDSFKPRGWQDRASIGWDKATDAQLADVNPAYNYLIGLPFVDPDRIGLLGFSMGGYDVLRIMERYDNEPREYQKPKFKVAASFYGVCHRLDSTSALRGPTNIFIGSVDDRANTNDCLNLVERSKQVNVNMTVYANALHGFDNDEFPPSKEIIDERGEHYHVGYNEAARAASMLDLHSYMDRFLKDNTN